MAKIVYRRRRSKREGKLKKLPAKINLRRTTGGAFSAQVCIGTFTGSRSYSSPGGHSTVMTSRCGNGTGKNPRRAIAKALRNAASIVDARSGAFAGLGRKR